MDQAARFESWLEFNLNLELGALTNSAPRGLARYRTEASQATSLSRGDLAKLPRAVAAGFATAFVLSTSGAVVASLAGHVTPFGDGVSTSPEAAPAEVVADDPAPRPGAVPHVFKVNTPPAPRAKPEQHPAYVRPLPPAPLPVVRRPLPPAPPVVRWPIPSPPPGDERKGPGRDGHGD